MSDGIYTYVDGESHFIRSERGISRVFGANATLDTIRYVDRPDPNLILLIPEAKVFWTRRMSPGQRTFYFASAAGDDAAIHRIRVQLRQFSLEPVVIVERKMLAEQRRQLLESHAVIEKPKGVDAAIIVQMLEDAQKDLYDTCNLYTSDVDFLPVIKAVMNRGKRVIVHGYRDGMSERSPLEYEPSEFVDLAEVLKTECHVPASF